MKAYVQLLSTTVDGEHLIEACGSSAIFILDGRQNLETHINDAHDWLTRQRRFSKSYVGCKVMRGDLKHSVMVYKYVMRDYAGLEEIDL